MTPFGSRNLRIGVIFKDKQKNPVWLSRLSNQAPLVGLFLRKNYKGGPATTNKKNESRDFHTRSHSPLPEPRPAIWNVSLCLIDSDQINILFSMLYCRVHMGSGVSPFFHSHLFLRTPTLWSWQVITLACPILCMQLPLQITSRTKKISIHPPPKYELLPPPFLSRLHWPDFLSFTPSFCLNRTKVGACIVVNNPPILCFEGNVQKCSSFATLGSKLYPLVDVSNVNINLSGNTFNLCTYIYILTYMLMYELAYLCAESHAKKDHSWTYLHTQTRTRAHTRINVYIQIHTHTHTHTHASSLLLPSPRNIHTHTYTPTPTHTQIFVNIWVYTTHAPV